MKAKDDFHERLEQLSNLNWDIGKSGRGVASVFIKAISSTKPLRDRFRKKFGESSLKYLYSAGVLADRLMAEEWHIQVKSKGWKQILPVLKKFKIK